MHDQLVPRRTKPSPESGFTLIEVVVALSLLGVVASVALLFFVRGIQATSHLQRSQSADAVAMEAMEQVRSIAAVAPTVGVSGILLGRTQTAVEVVWNAAAPADRLDSIVAWDPAATASSIPSVPIEGDSTRDGIAYHVTTLIGKCYRPSVSTGADQACGLTPVTGVPILRVTVVVTWKPTGTGQCGGAAVCTYRTRSLIDPTKDAVWNTTTKPVAYDDDNGVTTAKSPAQDFAAVSNDYIGPVTANPMYNITAPKYGTAAAVASAAPPFLLRYTPNGTSSGIEEFMYQLRDAAGRTSNQASVTIKVYPVAATLGPVDVVNDASVVIDLSSVVFGTFDAAATNVIVTSSFTSGGSVTSTTGTKVTYKAPATGTSASFKYTVTDTSGLVSPQATVNIKLTAAAPTLPVAPPLTYNFFANSGTPSPVGLSIFAQPGVSGVDPATSTIFLKSGAIGLSGSGSKTLTFTQVRNFAGVLKQDYYIQNNPGLRSAVPENAITINVNPVANPDGPISVARGKSTRFGVLGNDIPSTTLTVSSASTTCGSVRVESNQELTFTAPKNDDSCTVTYTVLTADGKLSASTSFVIAVTK